MKSILVVDDEMGSRESVKAVFGKEYLVHAADCAAVARQTLIQKPVDLLILDVMMPDLDGVSFLKEVQNAHVDLPVVMVSASTSVRPVVEAIRSGAVDYLTKPFDVEELRAIVHRAIERNVMRRKLEVLQTEVSQEFPVHGIIGRSPAFVKALQDAKLAAERDSTVLVTGESGTGKELVARLLHSASLRKDEPFVAVHCGSLPESLMESELFGHEKGAFTNADRRKAGRFELAGSGTLFFDEISEMSNTTQSKLLRVLQEREYMRIGGTQVLKTNARIVAATNKDLQEAIVEKRFREDLFYRINVVPLTIPPLRERSDDIPLLAQHFLEHFRRTMNLPVEGFSTDAMGLMINYRWPGNVRELRNIVERLLVLHGRKPTISADCLPREFHPQAAGAPLRPSTSLAGVSLEDAVNTYERDLVLNALRQANGVQTRAAELLGTTRRILKYRMVKLNIHDTEAVGVEG